MIGCHEKGTLAAFVLGGLDPGEAASVCTHVAGCRLCRREVDQLAAARRLLSSIPTGVVLDDVPLGPSVRGDPDGFGAYLKEEEPVDR